MWWNSCKGTLSKSDACNIRYIGFSSFIIFHFYPHRNSDMATINIDCCAVIYGNAYCAPPNLPSYMISLVFLLQLGWRYACLRIQSRFSHVTTLCNSVDCSPPGSSVHGILQARVPRGLPFPPPGVLTEPGIEPTSLMCLAVADRFFTTSTIWGDNVFSTKNNSIFWFLNYYLNYHLSLPFLAASYLLFLKISSFSLKVLFSIIMEGRGCSFTSKSKKKIKCILLISQKERQSGNILN